ncbi:hypothetical protein MJO28_006818 [Puccinia striiformis f. sp. tritici]|uniref:Uncharacterized protein n=1 Tax=Puccinia striiformis f. sp. tritici TaxID=168172 RepID=A0ACC0EI48_9BASI|nr:hypothetical protein MJO28_006818 [Puccinia striiformis f. sp. tritici]
MSSTGRSPPALRLLDDAGQKLASSRITLDIEAVEMENVGTDVVQESRIVIYDDCSTYKS